MPEARRRMRLSFGFFRFARGSRGWSLTSPVAGARLTIQGSSSPRESYQAWMLRRLVPRREKAAAMPCPALFRTWVYIRLRLPKWCLANEMPVSEALRRL